MTHLLKVFSLSLVTFAASFNPNESSKVELSLRISNISNEKSNIMVAIFDNPDHFLTEKVYLAKKVSVSDLTETLLLIDVEPGNYAIAIYQDLNANGELDKNFFMIPSEPYGFSNNYRPVFKGPEWSDVVFEAIEDQLIEVELK
jgi:uncharacterized protein (DUF2141 family)